MNCWNCDEILMNGESAILIVQLCLEVTIQLLFLNLECVLVTGF